VISRPFDIGHLGIRLDRTIEWSFSREIAMSVQTVAGKFMELCNQGKNFEAMRTMCTRRRWSRSRATARKRSASSPSSAHPRFGENNTIHGETLRGPFFCGDHNANFGQFAVFHTLDVTRKSSGQRQTIEEVALYTAKGDKITREEFFYDGIF
jgi:hypothetical protein